MIFDTHAHYDDPAFDADRDVVRRIARELRTAFHQESVLVTEDRISGCFLGE